ncbi:Trifunctional (S)-stylopine synthase 2/(S)-nandinine synthase/(S)-canadine synthase [Trichinella pseudospiralis]
MKFLLFYNSLATFCTSVLLLLFVFFRTKPDHRPEAPSTTHVQLALVMTTVGVALWLLYIQKAITGLSTVDVTNGFSGHRESRFVRSGNRVAAAAAAAALAALSSISSKHQR